MAAIVQTVAVGQKFKQIHFNDVYTSKLRLCFVFSHLVVHDDDDDDNSAKLSSDQNAQLNSTS